ncbi:MAG: acyl carrier protein [Elusimicrobiota bacterium]|jgi:acyl carrier protein|nr:acyl carrier protein [Elusimicrobiota bacterium]
MTKEETYVRLNKVFQDVFDDNSITVSDTTTAKDIENWDSLEHIQLIVAIEKEFKLKFNMAEIIALKEVGDIVNIILKRGS